MTFIEKYMDDHPQRILDPDWIDRVTYSFCPYEFEYEPIAKGLCIEQIDHVTCRNCWQREIQDS